LTSSMTLTLTKIGTEMITPHLKDILHIATGSSKIRGLAACGGRENPLVEFKAASLCSGDFGEGSSLLPLASPLHAVVTDLILIMTLKECLEWNYLSCLM